MISLTKDSLPYIFGRIILTNKWFYLSKKCKSTFGEFFLFEFSKLIIIQEIIEIDEQIEDEIQKGIIPDPSTIDPVTGQPLPQAGEGAGMEGMGEDPMAMGEVPAEPDMNAMAAEVDAQYQKDTKKAEL